MEGRAGPEEEEEEEGLLGPAETAAWLLDQSMERWSDGASAQEAPLALGMRAARDAAWALSAEGQERQVKEQPVRPAGAPHHAEGRRGPLPQGGVSEPGSWTVDARGPKAVHGRADRSQGRPGIRC